MPRDQFPLFTHPQLNIPLFSVSPQRKDRSNRSQRRRQWPSLMKLPLVQLHTRFTLFDVNSTWRARYIESLATEKIGLDSRARDETLIDRERENPARNTHACNRTSNMNSVAYKDNKTGLEYTKEGKLYIKSSSASSQSPTSEVLESKMLSFSPFVRRSCAGASCRT